MQPMANVVPFVYHTMRMVSTDRRVRGDGCFGPTSYTATGRAHGVTLLAIVVTLWHKVVEDIPDLGALAKSDTVGAVLDANMGGGWTVEGTVLHDGPHVNWLVTTVKGMYIVLWWRVFERDAMKDQVAVEDHQ